MSDTASCGITQGGTHAEDHDQDVRRLRGQELPGHLGNRHPGPDGGPGNARPGRQPGSGRRDARGRERGLRPGQPALRLAPVTGSILGNCFSEFRFSARRLETLPAYLVPEEAESLAAFRARRPVPERSLRTNDYLREVAEDVLAGRERLR